MINDNGVQVIIIAFSGKNGVGKSTIRQGLLNKLQDIQVYSFNKIHKLLVSFADKVKQCAYKYFMWDGKKDDKGRKLLQYIGTQVGRDYNQNCWIIHTQNKINQIIDNIQYGSLLLVLIDDLRFQNQAKWVHNNSGIIINLTRDTEVQRQNHRSQEGFSKDYYDYQFDLNDNKIQDNVNNISNIIINQIKQHLK